MGSWILRKMLSLGLYVRNLLRRRNLDQPHRTILDGFVGEVLPDIDVLGSFTSADDACDGGIKEYALECGIGVLWL